MLNCLIIVVDQFADYVGLPAMGHLEKIDIPSLATRALYSKATLSRGHSRSCCVEHSLRQLGLSDVYEVYLQSMIENSAAPK